MNRRQGVILLELVATIAAAYTVSALVRRWALRNTTRVVRLRSTGEVLASGPVERPPFVQRGVGTA